MKSRLLIAICLVITAASLGCTKATTSIVSITLPGYSVPSSIAKASISQSLSLAGGTLGFNQDVLSSANDVDCYAILVEKLSPNPFQCSRNDGAIVKAGHLTGVHTPGKTISIDVPTGGIGKIHVLGFLSRSGQCDDLYTRPFDYSNYSRPYVLGSAVIEFTPGDVNVTVSVAQTIA
ncbi:MAG: hypothetical protein V4760_02385, partial [Bdellovibrionota bacterium]